MPAALCHAHGIQQASLHRLQEVQKLWSESKVDLSVRNAGLGSKLGFPDRALAETAIGMPDAWSEFASGLLSTMLSHQQWIRFLAHGCVCLAAGEDPGEDCRKQKSEEEGQG
jgi:hypothetical protein